MLRTLISAMLMLAAVALPAVPSARAQNKTPEKKDEPKKGIADHIKWETKEFENAIQMELGLKMKSVSLQPAEIKGGLSEPERVKFLLEFDKDANYELKRLWMGRRVAIDYAYRRDSLGSVVLQEGRLELLYFDEENVRIGKDSQASSLEGDITGKKGEAFRLYVRLVNPKVLPNVKRIEVRLHPRLNIQQDKLSTEISKAIKWETGELQKTLESDYGLKLKGVSLVSVEKERHILLDCERTKVPPKEMPKGVPDLKRGDSLPLYHLAGFFDRPFKSPSGGVECHFYGADDTVLGTVKATAGALACCIDDPEQFGREAVGDRVALFVRTPGDAVLTKATKALLRIAAPEKLKEEER